MIDPWGPWRTCDQAEIAILEYLDRCNHRRLYSGAADLPPPTSRLRTRPRMVQSAHRAVLRTYDGSVGLPGCEVGLLGRDAVTYAPEWTVSSWFNSSPLSLHHLRGKVVILEPFQMLCPGCVAHSLPQATRLSGVFRNERVAVVGLHSVFENHAEMTPPKLEKFLRQSRIDFPVAIDAHRWDGEIYSPVTFDRYQMMGTPTTILIDQAGKIRFHQFGRFDDHAIIALVRQYLAETPVR